jgi:hypothetical protein
MIKFIYLILFIASNGVCVISSLCNWKIENNELECVNFTSFEQLNFINLTHRRYEIVSLWPNMDSKLKLDNKLNLKDIKLIQSSSSSKKYPKIVLSNLFGFDPFYNPFLDLSDNNTQFDLEIKNSIWSFNKLDCITSNSNLSFIFSDLKINKLKIEYPIFEDTICPLIFKNTQINELIFESLSPIRYDNLTIDYDLNIKIHSVTCLFGYDSFLTKLNSQTLLNQHMFQNLVELNFTNCYLDYIDRDSISKLKYLKSIRLESMLNYRNLFQNGFEWTHGLLNLIQLTIDYDYRKFSFNDSDLCLFKDFNYKSVLILFDKNDLNMISCGCTIYWLYRSYLEKIDDLIPLKNSLPWHCLNINQILLNEQLDYCNNEENIINECRLTIDYNITNTVLTLNDNCLPFDTNNNYCKCSFINDNLNILECDSNELITQMPTNFSLNNSIEWSYISFINTSIGSLTFKLPDLNIQQNGNLILDKIDFFDNDLFINNSKKKFRLVIQNSLFSSLLVKYPFRYANLSQLELNEFYFDSNRISIRAFEGSNIDRLILDKANLSSFSPIFKRELLFNPPRILKLEIKNIYDTFKKNSFDNLFGLDSLFLNDILFTDLVELEIKDTWLDFIQPEAFSNLLNLKIIRLENVNLKSIIDYYFNVVNSFDLIEFNDPNINFLSNQNLEKVYLGREMYAPNKFKFDNQTICFFASLNSATTIFIYDNLDYSDGIECSCSIYWIYRYIDYGNDLIYDLNNDYKYVPKCVKLLNNTSNLNVKLNECFNLNGYPDQFCKYPIVLTQPVQTSTSNNELTTWNQNHKNTTNMVSTYMFSTSRIIENDQILKKLDILTILVSILISILIISIIFYTSYKVLSFQKFKILIKKPIQNNKINPKDDEIEL